MASIFSLLPPLAEFFPPTPRAWTFCFNAVRAFGFASLFEWFPFITRPMGKTSSTSRFNLPGRISWVCAELLGPIALIYVLFSLPSKLKTISNGSTSFLGTGLPVQNEILGCLYVMHYINRAVITPIFIAPSISPMGFIVVSSMIAFQISNGMNLGCWLVYSTLDGFKPNPIVSVLSILSITIFFTGLVGNFVAERTIHMLRRGAAKRKAKSEGKAQITYDKVYVIPPASGFFKWILYPHYVFEWLEWTGYWMLGGVWGLGWSSKSMALVFLLADISTTWPRAVVGRRYYEEKFGKRAVAGRGAAAYILDCKRN